jgi:hypothetical protein
MASNAAACGRAEEECSSASLWVATAFREEVQYQQAVNPATNSMDGVASSLFTMLPPLLLVVVVLLVVVPPRCNMIDCA